MWLQGVTMRAPVWVTSSMLMQMTHSTPAGRQHGPHHLGNGAGLQHLAVNGGSEAQGAGAATWVDIAAEPQLLLLQSRSYCCGFMGASLKAIASAARKRQQQPNTDRC